MGARRVWTDETYTYIDIRIVEFILIGCSVLMITN